MNNECPWWEKKANLEEDEPMFHLREITTKKMVVESAFREYIVPFHMWQHNRDWVERNLKKDFEETTSFTVENIRSGARCGEKNSDVKITVSGHRANFTLVKES